MSKNQMKVEKFEDLLGIPSDSPLGKSAQSLLSLTPTASRQELTTEGDLAAFWGVSTRQVRKLVSEAVIAKVNGRFFDRATATQGYIRHLVAAAQRRNGSDPELREQKLRIANEQADLLELKNQEKRGELVSAKDVESEWADLLRTVRAGLLAVPARVGARLTLPQTHLSEIDIEIRAVLKELGE
ncbi:hypothetical protein QBK99_03375 [Corticibacterium sp. UT-5YL-CI-8]|nr:hypothetical protein [Tianweitania sp. UT-5YL-CI-8]